MNMLMNMPMNKSATISQSLPLKILVIGYGNVLRGDDGVGPLVVEQLAAEHWPLVRMLSVHQLLPELAADIAEAEEVFFVDACVATTQMAAPRIECLFPIATPQTGDHTWSPNTLLSLSHQLYGADPIAYQILIPALQFDYGTPLSTLAANGLDWAVATLYTFITEALMEAEEGVFCPLPLAPPLPSPALTLA